MQKTGKWFGEHANKTPFALASSIMGKDWTSMDARAKAPYVAMGQQRNAEKIAEIQQNPARGVGLHKEIDRGYAEEGIQELRGVDVVE